MRKAENRIVVLAGRNLKEILRDPLSFLFMTAMPLLMEILFYLLFHKLTSQFEMRALAPGIAVFAQAFLALFAGLLIALDRSSSFLTTLYLYGARSREFIAGYILALLPCSAAQSVLFFLVGGILEPAFFSRSMLWGVLLCLVTGLFYIGLGVLLGVICNERSVGGVASVVIAGQSLLSGMWFPAEGLGGGMLAVMQALPFRNATVLVQNAVNGAADPAADLIKPLAIVLAYTAAVCIAAVFLFKRKMERA